MVVGRFNEHRVRLFSVFHLAYSRNVYVCLFSLIDDLSKSDVFIMILVPELYVVLLEMIPTMAIKLATSTCMSVLTLCTADLVSMERKKMLMLSVIVWARSWFLWAPFIFPLRVYFAILPLTVFGTLSILGGLLMCIVNYGFHIKPKTAQLEANINNLIADESKNVSWFDRFPVKSYDVRQI